MQKRRDLFVCLGIIAAMPTLYVLSILWRVSTAEQRYFGRSYLIAMSPSQRQYPDPGTPESYGTATYNFELEGKNIKVFKQLINGFQHTYGSALVSFELGEQAADLLFRANEYAEAYLCNDGRTEKHFLDTRKDLYNNAVGRRIGSEARELHKRGRNAKRYMLARIFTAMNSQEVISHYLDPRVKQLPTLDEFGCPGLPEPNE